MEVIGFTAAILVGVILGILGSGGSILSVPILVYLFKMDTSIATASSLFVVGISSLIGTIPKYKQDLIDFKTAFLFGLPAVITVFFTRLFIVPNLPSEIFAISGFMITKSLLIMLVFGIMMIFASFSMIRKNYEEAEEQYFPNYLLIFSKGSFVGFLTGFVGSGGGFMIIPALMFLCKLTPKKAIGTSLLIIAANSLIGFMVDLSIHYTDFNWKILITFTALTIIGIFIGSYFTKFIDGKKLKIGFGWFILSMGIYIIAHELLF